jgi:hypothetical protein
MRRFPLLVLLTLVLASFPGFPLPARNAVAALPKPTCAQKRATCLQNADLRYIACQISEHSDCRARYEQAKQTCELNYQICLIFGS